jgi:hypothetical protein
MQYMSIMLFNEEPEAAPEVVFCAAALIDFNNFIVSKEGQL